MPPSPAAADLIARARALAPLLAAHAAEAERLRRPVDAVIEALRESGVFRMMVPRKYGGLELDLDTFLEVGLALSEGDASMAWVANFYVEHNWIVCQFPQAFQEELLGLVLHDRPVVEFVRGFVAELRAGRFDAELAYRKAIRKPLAEYTRTTPPHVKAARKQRVAAGRMVTYVVTRAGPEAVGETTAPPDYEHYVTQQLRPLADAVLRVIGGPDFDEIVGARRQLSLFP